VTKRLRVLRVAALITLCLACSCASCSPDIAPATPGRQLWASRLPGGCCAVGAVSPDGTTVFVAGNVRTKVETVAYRAATGARLWVSAAHGASISGAAAIMVSADGARIYLTGRTSSAPFRLATVAYDAGTGTQLWVSRYQSKGGATVSGLAVSPDGTTVYVTGSGRASGRQDEFLVIAYAAATGRQRWLRYFTKLKPGYAASVAVSPDGIAVYVTGSAGSPSVALTVAYGADGKLKWATRYKDSNPAGAAAGRQIVAAPGGGAVYVVGAATNESGHSDIATFAYRAATGQQLWMNRYDARIGAGEPQIALTPDDRTVIVTGQRNGGHAGGYALISYNARTGGTRWISTALGPGGLVIRPHGDALFIGGPPTAAYSVADGSQLWNISYPHGSDIIGINDDGTRLFETSWDSGGITTLAYQT
jgi:outer membrane protein assembly factor BamB